MSARKIMRKSKVWLYFEEEKIDLKYNQCKICAKKVVSSGNTTNLRNHLKTHKVDINDPIEFVFDKSSITTAVKDARKIEVCFYPATSFPSPFRVLIHKYINNAGEWEPIQTILINFITFFVF